MILWYFDVQDTLNGIYLTRLSYITQIYAMFAEKPLYVLCFLVFLYFLFAALTLEACAMHAQPKKVALVLTLHHQGDCMV